MGLVWEQKDMSCSLFMCYRLMFCHSSNQSYRVGVINKFVLFVLHHPEFCGHLAWERFWPAWQTLMIIWYARWTQFTEGEGGIWGQTSWSGSKTKSYIKVWIACVKLWWYINWHCLWNWTVVALKLFYRCSCVIDMCSFNTYKQKYE